MSISRLFAAVALPAAALVASAAEPHPSLPPSVIPECLGVNIHFTDPKPGELEMLAAAGFRWVRMDFTWGGTEREKGEYDFAAYDRLVTALDKQKLRAIFILDYGNKLYPNGEPPTTDEARAAFSKWAVAAVSHFKGRGYLWEMWNEPNGGFWKSSDKTGDYIALAKATGGALKQAGLLGAKGEAFIGPATSEIDLPYLETCFKAGLLEFWDAVSVHPYRQSAPETVEEEYRSLRLLVRKYAPKDKTIPILSGEWGYSTQYSAFAGKDAAARDEQQAKWLARMFLTNIANDVALSIWYDWHDDGTNPKEIEHHFGVVAHEYHAGRDPVYDPKPAYTAMKTMTEQLGGMSFNKRFYSPSPDRERTYLFASQKATRLAEWAQRENDMPASRDNVERVGFLGAAVGGLYALTSPVYLTANGERASKALQIAASWTRLPLEYVIKAPVEIKVTAALHHAPKLPGAAKVGVTIEGPDKELEYAEWTESKTALSENGDFAAVSIRVPQRQAGLRLVQQLTVGKPPEEPGDKADGFEFLQDTPLVIQNAIEAEALAPGTKEIPIRIFNPSGDPLEGNATVVRAWSVAGDAPLNLKRTLKIMSGEHETILLVERPPALKELPSLAVSIDVRGEPTFFQSIGQSFSVPFPSTDKLSIALDGAKEVEGHSSLDDASPATGLPPAIDRAVRCKYRFAAGWKFCQLRGEFGAIRILWGKGENGHGIAQRFGLWIYGDGKRCQARIRFIDSTRQTFQADGQVIDWTGWRFVTFPMASNEFPLRGTVLPQRYLLSRDEKPLAHWGGANDGVIHYPIEWDSIFLLDNVSRQPVEGEIYLSAPTLIY